MPSKKKKRVSSASKQSSQQLLLLGVLILLLGLVYYAAVSGRFSLFPKAATTPGIGSSEVTSQSTSSVDRVCIRDFRVGIDPSRCEGTVKFSCASRVSRFTGETGWKISNLKFYCSTRTFDRTFYCSISGRPCARIDYESAAWMAANRFCRCPLLLETKPKLSPIKLPVKASPTP